MSMIMLMGSTQNRQGWSWGPTKGTWMSDQTCDQAGKQAVGESVTETGLGQCIGMAHLHCSRELADCNTGRTEV